MNRFFKFLGGEKIANAFRRMVSGDPSGAPNWAQQMAVGEDEGLFGPESDVWKVHGSLATLVGGVRALLMQAAYPAALAGVAQHSNYDTDPLGRLERTTRWLTITSFGSSEAIDREARRVREMHSRVVGDYTDKGGSSKRYSAEEERHLLWVHCAFTDSFLAAYRTLDRARDRSVPHYVGEWSKSALPLGLKSAPMSDSELSETLEEFINKELATTAQTREIVGFIIKPPFSPLAMPFYRVLCNAAISTMDTRVLAILGLKRRSSLWLKIITPQLRILQMLLGDESPSQKIARARIERLRSGL
jgi:uncharacterized protein (DUF2236 family)